MDDPGSSGQWLLLIVFLLLSGFFSAFETAVMSIGRIRLKYLSDSGDQAARRIQALKSDPSKFLGSVLVGNNVVNIALTSVMTAISLALFGRYGLTVALVASTVSIVLFGEILPKSLAANSPESVARRLARPGEVAIKVLYPFSWAFTGIVNLLLSAAGARSPGVVPITSEELQNIVDVAEEQGSLDADERQMIQGIFQFGDTSVSDIMVPYPDILAVPSSLPVKDAVDLVLKGHFSRIPVYAETPETIAGFIHVKDLLKAYIQDPDSTVASLIRPILFVPETKKVDELFDQMRLQRIHVAIALDEYGSTSGLVTMEDILEEIVGDIMDEYDPADTAVLRQQDGSYLVDGRVSLEDVKELTGLDFQGTDEDIDTVGGLAFHMVGRIPRVGDTVEDPRATIRVEEMKGRRVVKVRLWPRSEDGPEVE